MNKLSYLISLLEKETLRSELEKKPLEFLKGLLYEVKKQYKIDVKTFSEKEKNNANVAINILKSYHLSAEKNPPPLLSLDEIFFYPEIEADWLVDSLVISNGITLITALPNHYKSFVTQMIAVSVASGKPFLGRFKSQQGNVLIIDREIPPMRLKKRWKLIGDTEGLPIQFFNYSLPFKLDDPKSMELLKQLIYDNEFILVIIDTFNRSNSGKDINQSNEVGKLFEPLKELLDETSFIITHHSNKSGFRNEKPAPDEFLGSINFTAEVDMHFALKKNEDNTIAFYNFKARDSELLKPFNMKFIINENKAELLYIGDIQAPVPPNQAREDKIIEFLKEGKKLKSEIVSHFKAQGEKEGTIDNALTSLRRDKKIDSDNVGKEAVYFLIENIRQNENDVSQISNSIDNGNLGNVEDKKLKEFQNVSQIDYGLLDSYDTKRNIILEERRIREQLNLLQKNSNEYGKLYSHWVSLRNYGLKLGLFAFFAPSEHEPWMDIDAFKGL